MENQAKTGTVVSDTPTSNTGNTPVAGDQTVVTIDMQALEATIAEQKATIEAHEKTIADQKATIEEYEQALSDRDSEISRLTSQMAEKDEALQKHKSIIAKLSAGKPEEKEETAKPKKTARIPNEPVEHEGKKYRFKFPAFYFKAIRYEAQDAALDDELIGKIIAEKGQTILIEVY